MSTPKKWFSFVENGNYKGSEPNFFDISQKPWALLLENNQQIILNELEVLIGKQNKNIVPYFNQTLANYLFLRATYWPNDNEKTIKTLNIIRLFLQQAVENSDRNFDSLIFIYNGVLQRLYSYYRNELLRQNQNAVSYNTNLPAIIGRNF